MIRESASRRFQDRSGYSQNCWVCSCQRCGKSARPGNSPGDAADNARLALFVTTPGKRLTDPSLWFCSAGCAERFISEKPAS